MFLSAYPGAARVNQAPPNSGTVDYMAINHMIIFVQPIADSNETYMVDVGFGGSNLAQPILLSDAKTNIVWGAVPPERHRLTRGPHSSSSLGEISIPYLLIGPSSPDLLTCSIRNV